MMMKLVVRNLLRRPLRTALTGLTVAACVLVFVLLLAVDGGVRRMVERTGGDAVLIVFERYKACPPYSRLPVHYADRIAEIDGVRDVMPVRFLLSNCQTTTDLVAVHGVDPARLRRFRDLRVADDEYEAFAGEPGAALVGRAVAERYGWRLGETVTLRELRGMSFVVRGTFDAPGSSLESVILLDRRFVEYSIDEVGVATMFTVLLDHPDSIDTVSRQIDAMFANYPARTRSGPEKAFIVDSIEDFMHMVRFAQVVAYLALGLVLAAVSNGISMSVRERLRETALLRTRGFTRGLVVRLILAESLLGAALAALVGLGAAALVLSMGRFSISIEGYTITPHLAGGIAALALLAGAALGLLGAILPAVRAVRVPIVPALREVN
jgi:putative ABC transport system permease protein